MPPAGNAKLDDVGRPPRRPWMVAADLFFCVFCLFTLIKNITSHNTVILFSVRFVIHSTNPGLVEIGWPLGLVVI